MMEATFVIIGGGISGITCAKSINFLSPDVSTILITSNSLIKQVKSVIPVGRVSLELKITETNSQILEDENSLLKIINDSVIEINPREKLIITENNLIIKYKKLCICTGARPRLISDNDFVIGIRDTESVDNFSKKISKARRIIVVGNGGIATEIVYKIKNVEIIWVIKDKHISATFVDPGAAEFFKTKLSENEEKLKNNLCKRIKYKIEKMAGNERKINGPSLGPDWREIFESRGILNDDKNVIIEYESEINQILTPDDAKSRDYPVYVELNTGKIIGCDFIVSATGVLPNSDIKGLEIVEKCGDGGLLVDWKLETSVEDIYAAGDVCTANWRLSDHWFQMKLWTQAYQMGCYAGKSMVSSFKNEHFLQDFCFEIFTHVTEFFGYKIVLLGLFNGQKLSDDYEILLRMTRDKEYIKLVIKDGKLQGAVLIGNTDLEEMCENLILNQLDISIYGDDLLNPDIDIDDYFD